MMRILPWLLPVSRLLRRLSNLYPRMLDSAFTELQDASLETISDKLHIPQPDAPEWKAIEALCSREYFTRAWVFQKLVLAPSASLICGALFLDWDLFQKFDFIMAIIHTKLNALSGFYMPRRLPASTLSVSRRIFNSEIDYRNPFLELNALLYRQRKCKAIDPRDKVFSLLSIATGDAVPSIKVNYHQAVEETYTYTARNIIEAAKQLRILVCVDIPRQESTLPSWVPDWRFDTNIPNPLASNVSDKESREVQYSATGNSKTILTKQPDPFKLSLLGLHMGQICHASPPAITDSEDPDFNLDAILKDKSAWTDIALSAAIQGGLYLPTGEPFMTVFTRTRTAGKWADDEMGKASASSDPEYATATRAMASMLLCVPNRLLFTTSNGYMGLGPKMAQVGDLVYLLLGGELPYVLRRQEDTGTFQFIGECYVHGLMNGEGLVDARKKSRPTEVPPEDNSWLDRLDELEEGELPFETEVVTLV